MKKHSIIIVTVGIVLLAFILRFYDYGNRWELGYDQAHDALVARAALAEHKIPLLGPFSSAGPFQTGGQWYWFIMAATALYPASVLTPWIVLTLIYVFFVYLMIQFGTELIDTKFGILLGLFSAVSTAQIAQSVSLTNESPLAIISIFALWSVVRFLRSGKNRYIFALGFLISTGASFHLQGSGLFILGICVLIAQITEKKFHVSNVLLLLAGGIIGALPILLFDIRNGFVNMRNMIYYIRFDQYRIPLEALGRRWLTYLTIYWPTTWGRIIGGNQFIGAGFMILVSVLFIYGCIRKKIVAEFIVIICSFFGILGMLRYSHVPLFDSYTVFLQPFILTLSAWVVYKIFMKSRFLGILVCLFVVIMSFTSDCREITGKVNVVDQLVKIWKTSLYSRYPGKHIALYDYKAQYPLPLALELFLEAEGRAGEAGIKIGMNMIPSNNVENRQSFRIGGTSFLDLSGSSSAELSKAGYQRINSSEIYRQTEEWR